MLSDTDQRLGVSISFIVNVTTVPSSLQARHSHVSSTVKQTSYATRLFFREDVAKALVSGGEVEIDAAILVLEHVPLSKECDKKEKQSF